MKLFENVAGANGKNSKFDLTHEKKFSFNMGDLIPTYVQEVVPGDKLNVNAEQLIRLAPMIAPMMHRVNVSTHFFFVPNRIVWDNWESFITGGRQGDELPQVPTLTISDTTKQRYAKGSLADFLGIPPASEIATVNTPVDISSIPFRAYQEIYQEYYQDQNLNEELDYYKGNGHSSNDQEVEVTTMRKRAWEKDYFTSALPWAQRGGEAVLPLTNDVTYMNPSRVYNNADDPAGDNSNLSTSRGGNLFAETPTSQTVRIENIQGIESELTINELRKLVRLQEWLEKTARAGSRYIEQILSHFGVRSSDQRLQRPEYLGGGKSPITISEVLNQTGALNTEAPNDVDFLPQGNMSGHGIAVGANHGFSRRFEEHGYVIGIMSVLPKTAYSQGIPRHFSRKDKFDYYWKEFANLGEQEILNQEIYADLATASAPNEETFGYQSRYSDYKYTPSTVHGDFRDELDFWHMSRIFQSLPALNNSFVEANPTDRIFAVTDDNEDKLYAQVLNKVSAIRPMPYFGTPRL